MKRLFFCCLSNEFFVRLSHILFLNYVKLCKQLNGIKMLKWIIKQNNRENGKSQVICSRGRGFLRQFDSQISTIICSRFYF